MKKNRRPAWLLTVASAYSLVPGCGDDVTNDDAAGNTDAGIVAVPPDAGFHLDAGIVLRADSGPIGVVIVPDAGNWLGTVITPPDAGTDAAVDAGGLDAGDRAIGVVLLPPTDT